MYHILLAFFRSSLRHKISLGRGQASSSLCSTPVLAIVVAIIGALYPSDIAAFPGDLDLSFGTGGKVITDLGGNDVAREVFIRNDGTIMVVASTGLLRYTRNGGLDPDYGMRGIVKTDFGFDTGMALTADGSAVVLDKTGLLKFTADGSIDTRFGDAGEVSIDCGRLGRVSDITIDGEGRILLIGSSHIDAYSGFCVIRLNPDGSQDASFGVSGRIISDLGHHSIGRAIAANADGTIVAAGEIRGDESDGPDFAIVRYLADGTIDTDFGKSGLSEADLGQDFVGDLIIQESGAILIAGASGFKLARFLPSGHLDSTFGARGVFLNDFGAANTITQSADGTIVMAGQTGSGARDFGLLRVAADGTLDTTFGADGFVVTDVGSDDVPYSSALHGDNTLIVVGVSDGDIAAVRYKLTAHQSQVYLPALARD